LFCGRPAVGGYTPTCRIITLTQGIIQRMHNFAVSVLAAIQTALRAVWKALRWVWKTLTHIALSPISMSRVGFYLIMFFLLVGAVLWQLFPSVGIAIGLLGAGAIVVAIRLEHNATLAEKIGWIVVAFVLFGFEVNVVYRQEEETHRKAQETAKRFQEAGESLRSISGQIDDATQKNQRQLD